MAAISGKLAKVMYGAVKIAGMGSWTLSGYEAQVLETTELGDTVQKFIFGGAANPGTVTFSGNYDPADTTGQIALNTACKSEVLLTNLYFYETATKYWAVDVGGSILITKADAMTMDRNAIGKIDFSGKVSGAAMVVKGT